MDFAIFEWIVSQSGLAMVAALALWIMWLQQRDALRRERENSEIHRQDKLRITGVLEDVARSNTELCQLIRELRNDMRERH